MLLKTHLSMDPTPPFHRIVFTVRYVWGRLKQVNQHALVIVRVPCLELPCSDNITISSESRRLRVWFRDTLVCKRLLSLTTDPDDLLNEQRWNLLIILIACLALSTINEGAYLSSLAFYSHFDNHRLFTLLMHAGMQSFFFPVRNLTGLDSLRQAIEDHRKPFSSVLRLSETRLS